MKKKSERRDYQEGRKEICLNYNYEKKMNSYSSFAYLKKARAHALKRTKIREGGGARFDAEEEGRSELHSVTCRGKKKEKIIIKSFPKY